MAIPNFSGQPNQAVQFGQNGLNAVNAAGGGPQGVFWRGADGKVYVKGDRGTNAAGGWDANTQGYWGSRGFREIPDPMRQGGNTQNNQRTSGSGTAAATQNYDVSLYDQAINNNQSATGALDTQLNTGYGNIDTDYNNQVAALDKAFNRNTQDYTTNKINTTKENQSARSNIDFATGQRANALQRLLGSKGAGSSSAARVAAPYAAAVEGTQQLNQVGDAYAQNMTGLDTTYKKYSEDVADSRTSLEAQKKTNRAELERTVAQKRQELLTNLATLQAQRAQAAGGNPVAASQATFNQVNALNQTIAGLGKSFAGRVTAANPNYVAPELSKYTYNPQSTIGGVNNGANQQIAPYLNLVQGKSKEEKK